MLRSTLLLALLAVTALPAAAHAHAPADPSQILYRVNAGGEGIAGTPAWQADFTGAPSPYTNAAATGDATNWTMAPVDVAHPSIPAGTPAALFASERFDEAAAPPMAWDFPVDPGRYDVHLYFAEIYSGAFARGEREFDVSIEGTKVLDDYDIFADVGANTAVMKGFEVTSDGTLDIDFGNGVQNPTVSAIEIVRVPTPAPGLVATPGTVAFGTVPVGDTKSLPVKVQHTGALGAAPITIEAAAISGAGAAHFGDDFDDAVDVVLQPGESTTVSTSFSPTTSGSKTATLTFTRAGGATFTVPLTGSAPTVSPVGFGKSTLTGVTGYSPTTIQWGPDGRLYVGDFDGSIRAYTVSRDAANDYEATDVEMISTLQQIPNHDDDGTPNATVDTRLLTGLLVTGTASVPVIYATTSDPRIGAGPDGADLNLDTNSGIVSRLTKSGATWQHVPLVRGLPRSEENHAANGLALDPATETLYVTQGGNTNSGAPSNNFAKLPEYALSAAILSVDLDAIGDTTYDLPTLNDETRPGAADANDPFGGNNGKNQATWTGTGPVKVHAPGFRNPYDVVLTESGKLYTFDNGANAGWGAAPVGEGPGGTCTNALSEPGDTDPDELHLITGPGYYGGHPNPTRANTANTFNPTNPQAAVTTGNPIECDAVPGGSAGSKALLTDWSSTNGLVEYTATNFGGAMKGDLLAASYDNALLRIALGTGGTTATKSTLAANFGGAPLDVTAQGDAGAFPGTIWITDQWTNEIHIFEPVDYGGAATTCTGADDAGLDEDADGFDNADEIDAGSAPCSPADTPADQDGDRTSDLNDPDDDNDGRSDVSDEFALDAQNGKGRSLPVSYTWENDSGSPGGIMNLGFTGLMTNGSTDYRTLYDETKLTAGGAAGVLTFDDASEGDALGSRNDQSQALQFGVDAAPQTAPFAARSRIVGPFAGLTPAGEQSMGVFVGSGDQDNYVKAVVTRTGVELVREVAGVATTVAQAEVALPGPTAIDLWITVDPATDTAFASYAVDQGTRRALGPRVAIPKDWTEDASTGLAVGIISTSRGEAPSFPATWDFVSVSEDPAAPPPVLPPDEEQGDDGAAEEEPRRPPAIVEPRPPAPAPVPEPESPRAPRVVGPDLPPVVRDVLVSPRLSIAAAVSRGVTIRCRGASGDRCRVELVVSKATARRLRLPGRVVGRSQILATRSAKVRLTAAARRALRLARGSIAVEMRGTVVGRGRPARVTRRLALLPKSR